MSDGQLSEGVGPRAKKEELDPAVVPFPAPAEELVPTIQPPVFDCRWDRDLKPGDKADWFSIYGTDPTEAAKNFAAFVDGSNPRPPLRRVCIVRKHDGNEQKILVTVKTVRLYEAWGTW